MKKVKINLKQTALEQVKLIISILKKGKIVVLPTDTIYGLSCLAKNVKAIERMRQIKKLPANKPLLVLVSSLAMVKKYCRVNKKQEKYLMKIWPNLTPALSLVRRGGIRPVTVVLNLKKNLPRELTAGTSSLAVRLPKSEFLFKIITGVGQPIVSTSLNISGQKSLNNLNNLDNYFKKVRPDLVVDAGRAKRVKPSKLVDLRNMTQIKILRK